MNKSETSSSKAEEECEDLWSASSSMDASESEEEERIAPQPDPVQDPKSPPIFQIRRPVTRLASKLGPFARTKLQASKKEPLGQAAA